MSQGDHLGQRSISMSKFKKLNCIMKPAYICGRFLASFIFTQYNPLVRFDLVCRFDARHSNN